MKRFILICFFSLWTSLSFAAQTPKDNSVILDIEPDKEETIVPVKFTDILETVVEVGQYFEKNYPDNQINSDLKPDIEKFFPNSTAQQLYDRESLIRNSIKIFRWGKALFNDIKSHLLVPEPPILTYKDSDYENPKDYTYEDVGENKVRIVTDIKKVISYSPDIKEKKNYEAHLKKNEDNAKIEAVFPGFNKLKRVYEKIELKKLPLYGIIYQDPKTDGEGITPWLEQKHTKIRLSSNQSRLENQPQIKGIVHFKLDSEWAILAEPYNNFPEISVDFSKSKNIKHCNLFRPVPLRAYFEDGDLIIYGNNFAYPFICTVQDTLQEAEIDAQINYALCNNQKECLTETADLQLTIKEGEGFRTVAHNFIEQTFNYLPLQEEKDIVFKDVSVEKNDLSPTGKTLRLIIESKNDFDKPEIFVRTPNNVKLSHPKTAIDNKTISIRQDILTADAELENTEVEITILIDRYHAYRITKNVQSSSIFDINSRQLNLGLLLLAMLGGFILNFMPCVFPVLSLKILFLTNFGAKNKHHIRKTLLLNICGILSGFLGLSAILSLLKIIGHNLGWGMQFQNPIFILIMIFAIILFIAQLQEIIRLRLPSDTGFQKKQLPPLWESFFSGLLIVLMATPCTGPYLGTTIGFALAGSVSDIFAVLTAVALGLSLPYILLLCAPNLSLLIPPPGEWMKNTRNFMTFMLLLTIIWLLCILKAQSSWLTVSCVIAIALLFTFTLIIYSKTVNEITRLSENNKKNLIKATNLLRKICIGILFTLFIISLVIGKIGFNNHQSITKQTTENTLDFNKIGQYVAEGHNVLIKVGADWCLTCSYNNFLVFDNTSTEAVYKKYNMKIINIDWTEYNPEILEFMGEYGRRGLPFYILYNQNVPEGLVLPEILSQMEFEKIMNNSAVTTQDKSSL